MLFIAVNRFMVSPCFLDRRKKFSIRLLARSSSFLLSFLFTSANTKMTYSQLLEAPHCPHPAASPAPSQERQLFPCTTQAPQAQTQATPVTALLGRSFEL